MIAVVILNWNGSAMMRRFLPSVIAGCAGEGEVIVADNGSTDDSLEMLRTEFPEVRILALDQNYGFAEGYNQAFKKLEEESGPNYEYLLLLNSDVECTDGWLRPLREYMDAHPDCAACQPKVRAEWDRSRLEYAGACGGFIDRDGYPFCRGRIFGVAEEDKGQYDTVADIFWATGAALMIRAKDWQEVGGLDGRFFAHNEEIDLCWRLRSRSRRIVCVPQSVVYHVGGGTLPQDNPRKTYLNFRNNLTMLYKNLPEGEMQRVLRRRTVLDWVAALQFMAKLDFANARAIFRARRDYKAWRRDFEADRRANLAAMVVNPIPERRDISLLWQYYARGRKRYQQLPNR
ncbi:MAG: glycosyltransferase family 2 protein [Bacteroidales bacterium]|nr:glycosyltransferase family 2 protein [Bacteroidales bacterium]